MTAPTVAAGIVVPPNGGRAVRAFGNEITFKLTSESTGGALVLGLATVPAGSAGPPMHVHENEDELFIILEGQYRVCVEGEWSEAGPGSVVFLPRGLAHTFLVVGERPGRHWVLTNAAGFDRFYAHSAEVLAQPGPPNFPALAAVAAAHGYRFVRPEAAG